MGQILSYPEQTSYNSNDKLLLQDGASNDTKYTQYATLAKAIRDSAGGWEQLGRTTLGASNNTITVNSLSARSYLRIIVYVIATGGTINIGVRFNNDSGSDYAARISSNGGADATGASISVAGLASVGAYPQLLITDIINFAAQEKIATSLVVGQAAAGAANAPTREEGSYKWANTSNQISRVDIINYAGGGNFASGSDVIVLGHN